MAENRWHEEITSLLPYALQLVLTSLQLLPRVTLTWKMDIANTL